MAWYSNTWNIVTGAVGSAAGSVTAALATASPNTLAIVTFGAAIVSVAAKQQIYSHPALRKLTNDKLDEYNSNALNELKCARPPHYGNSVLPRGASLLGGSSASSSSSSSSSSSNSSSSSRSGSSSSSSASAGAYSGNGMGLDGLGSPVNLNSVPTKNFFQFRPPARSLPSPDLFLKPCSPAPQDDANAHLISESNIAAHSASYDAVDKRRASLGSLGSPDSNCLSSKSSLPPKSSAISMTAAGASRESTERKAGDGGETDSIRSQESSQTLFSFDSNVSQVRLLPAPFLGTHTPFLSFSVFLLSLTPLPEL